MIGVRGMDKKGVKVMDTKDTKDTKDKTMKGMKGMDTMDKGNKGNKGNKGSLLALVWVGSMAQHLWDGADSYDGEDGEKVCGHVWEYDSIVEESTGKILGRSDTGELVFVKTIPAVKCDDLSEADKLVRGIIHCGHNRKDWALNVPMLIRGIKVKGDDSKGLGGIALEGLAVMASESNHAALDALIEFTRDQPSVEDVKRACEKVLNDTWYYKGWAGLGEGDTLKGLADRNLSKHKNRDRVKEKDMSDKVDGDTSLARLAHRVANKEALDKVFRDLDGLEGIDDWKI